MREISFLTDLKKEEVLNSTIFLWFDFDDTFFLIKSWYFPCDSISSSFDNGIHEFKMFYFL